MSADIAELIEHLARHEGGALGCSPVVLITPAGDLLAGVSVDDLLVHLRGIASLPWSGGKPRVVTATAQTGQVVELARVLGYDLNTACVAIEATEVTP